MQRLKLIYKNGALTMLVICVAATTITPKMLRHTTVA